MEQTRTLEERHLEAAESLLRDVARLCHSPSEARTQVLEAAAAKIGEFALADYHNLIGVERLNGIDLEGASSKLIVEVLRTPIPPGLALAALARPAQAEVEKKRAGAWNTDWRLANLMASGFSCPLVGTLLDPACGTGALLIAVALKQAGRDRKLRTAFVAEQVCGSDLDPRAIRGASLSLASLTSDLGAIRTMLKRLRVADALIAPEQTWHDQTARGQPQFGAIVGNPPWERLRITRHEHLAVSGLATHYGDSIADDLVRQAGHIDSLRNQLSNYRRGVRADYDLQGQGEVDLYKLFTELAFRFLGDDGELSWLLPGGIIRSQGTEELRAHLLDHCSFLRMTVFSNIGRFFSVYRRQKFVLVEARVGHGTRRPLELRHGDGMPSAVAVTDPVPIGRASLRRLRADLAVPEVRTHKAWCSYLQMASSGTRVRDWNPAFLREVDMSLDRHWFLTRPQDEAVGLIEGRMVHQYRHDAKRHRSGTGRAARWEVTAKTSACTPTGQYWIPTNRLSDAAHARVGVQRVGFCDITGQTNERGMLCAPIPSGYVCGNKVPTITFDGHRDPSCVGYAFMAIANSLAFDWVLRRMISTTVNYFLLRDLPWPDIDPDSLPARRLAMLASQLGGCAHARMAQLFDPVERQDLRLAVELLVAEVWRIPFSGMKEILGDFPLLDGGCPTLPDERRSTITRDLLLLRLGEREGVTHRELSVLRERVERAQELGAIAFEPTQFADAADDDACVAV